MISMTGKVMWYEGEAFRILPNIEIWYNEEDELVTFSFVCGKFVWNLPLCIKWKKKVKGWLRKPVNGLKNICPSFIVASL